MSKGNLQKLEGCLVNPLFMAQRSLLQNINDHTNVVLRGKSAGKISKQNSEKDLNQAVSNRGGDKNSKSNPPMEKILS